MSMENIIKEEVEKIVDNFKKGLESKGTQLDGINEFMFRSGISYGITIASIALSKLPVDITFATDMEKDELPTRDGYIQNRNRILSINDKPLYKCPKCGSGVRRDDSVIYTSNPPKYKYECENPNCGFIEYL